MSPQNGHHDCFFVSCSRRVRRFDSGRWNNSLEDQLATPSLLAEVLLLAILAALHYLWRRRKTKSHTLAGHPPLSRRAGGGSARLASCGPEREPSQWDSNAFLPPNLAAQDLASIYEGDRFDFAILALTQAGISKFDRDVAHDFRSRPNELTKCRPLCTSG